jgi:hypothetical protein
MTNENLKVGDVELPELEIVISKLEQGLHLGYPRIINLIKSQQSRIDLLESAIRDAAEYHRGYVEKLKESDPDRSLRQQERVNYFMDILENKS